MNGPARPAVPLSPSATADRPCEESISRRRRYGAWRSDFQGLGRHCRAAVDAIAAITRLLIPQRDDIAVLKSPSLGFLRDALATSAAAVGSPRTHHHRHVDRVVRYCSPHGCYVRGYRLRVRRTAWRARRRTHGCSTRMHGRIARLRTLRPVRPPCPRAGERASESQSSGTDASPTRPQCRRHTPPPPAAN